MAVTQLVRGDHLLRGFDLEASHAVQEGMEAERHRHPLRPQPCPIAGEPGALVVTTQSGE